MTMNIRRISLLVFMAALAVMPLLPVPEFWITQANYIGLYALVAIGLVLLTGVAGLTSFGQAAFVGMGAYTTAYLTTAHEMSPWITVWIGLAITGLAALVLGWITLRMSGHYLRGDHRLGLSLYYLLATSTPGQVRLPLVGRPQLLRHRVAIGSRFSPSC